MSWVIIDCIPFYKHRVHKWYERQNSLIFMTIIKWIRYKQNTFILYNWIVKSLAQHCNVLEYALTFCETCQLQWKLGLKYVEFLICVPLPYEMTYVFFYHFYVFCCCFFINVSSCQKVSIECCCLCVDASFVSIRIDAGVFTSPWTSSTTKFFFNYNVCNADYYYRLVHLIQFTSWNPYNAPMIKSIE